MSGARVAVGRVSAALTLPDQPWAYPLVDVLSDLAASDETGWAVTVMAATVREPARVRVSVDTPALGRHVAALLTPAAEPSRVGEDHVWLGSGDDVALAVVAPAPQVDMGVYHRLVEDLDAAGEHAAAEAVREVLRRLR